MAYIDLIGQRFGRLTVESKGSGRRTSGGHYKATWNCLCDCGNRATVDGEKLRRGHTTSCGCLKKENKGSRFDDLIGRKFGRLTVVRFVPQEERTVRTYNWWCVCDCGNEIKANSNKLKNGLQQSCGCLKEEMKPLIGEVNRKYAFSNNRLYAVYRSMLSRCYDKRQREYGNYGGRGITVCDEWIGEDGYDVFAKYAIMSGYDENASFHECTLDRIDTNGNYEPGNIRWVTNIEQQNNRRDCVMMTHEGETHTMKEWSRIIGAPYGTLYWRCRKKNWTIGEFIKWYGSQ